MRVGETGAESPLCQIPNITGMGDQLIENPKASPTSGLTPNAAFVSAGAACGYFDQSHFIIHTNHLPITDALRAPLS